MQGPSELIQGGIIRRPLRKTQALLPRDALGTGPSVGWPPFSLNRYTCQGPERDLGRGTSGCLRRRKTVIKQGGGVEDAHNPQRRHRNTTARRRGDAQAG